MKGNLEAIVSEWERRRTAAADDSNTLKSARARLFEAKAESAARYAVGECVNPPNRDCASAAADLPGRISLAGAAGL